MCCQLLHHGIGLSTASDTELIAHALCQQPTEEKDSLSPNWVARLIVSSVKVIAALSFMEITVFTLCLLQQNADWL